MRRLGGDLNAYKCNKTIRQAALYDSYYRTFWKSKSTGPVKSSVVANGQGEGGRNRQREHR